MAALLFLGVVLPFVDVPSTTVLWRLPFDLTSPFEFRTRARVIDSCVTVDPLPLDPLEDAVIPERRETRELVAVLLTVTRLFFLSCIVCARELSMMPDGP